MINMKIKGLDDFENKLSKLSNNAKSISGTSKVPFDELFTTDFMKNNTNYNSISDFLYASPEKISSEEEFHNADGEILDSFVAEQTSFASWEEMFVSATKALLISQLGL